VPVGLLLHRSGHVHRHARVHYAHEDHRHHGRGGRKADLLCGLGRREGDGPYLGLNISRLRYHRLFHGETVSLDLLGKREDIGR